MRTKEERILDAIGDTNDRNVLIAVGHESADAGFRTEIRRGEFTETAKPSDSDIKRYRIRNGIIGGMAAAAAVAGGLVLWNTLKDSAVDVNPADSTTAPIVTIVQPSETSASSAVQQVESSYIVESAPDNGRFLRLVCSDDHIYTNDDGLREIDGEYARVELVDDITNEVYGTAPFVTKELTVTLYGNIEIKFSSDRAAEYTGLIFVPQQDGTYFMTVYSSFGARNDLDYSPALMMTVQSPDSVQFTDMGENITIDGTKYSLYNVWSYDNNTPYPYLYRGQDESEMLAYGNVLRFDCDIDSPWYSPDASGDDQTAQNGLYPNHASMQLSGLSNDPDSADYYNAENAYITVSGRDAELGSAPLTTEGYGQNNYRLSFDKKGSFNIITHTLSDGRVIILAGVPRNRRFVVTVYVFDGTKLGQIRGLYIETEYPLEEIKCGDSGGMIYRDTNKGMKDIQLDFENFTYSDSLGDEAKAAVDALRELAGSDFAYPVDASAGMSTFAYDGDKFTVRPDIYNGSIYAVTGGTVTEVGYAKGYGEYMTVTDANGVPWTYAGLYYHMNAAEGDTVIAGQKISYAVNEVSIYPNKTVTAEPFTNPMTGWFDEGGVKVEIGELLPSEELSEFSADNSITRRFIGWADEWAATHDEQYKWYTIGEFLDGLGVPELKELYFKGKFLAGALVTDDFSDIDGYKGVTQYDGFNGTADAAVIEVPDSETDGAYMEYWSSGFSYESFCSAWMSVFTEEWALTMLNLHPDTFVKYGDELFFISTAAGGDVSHVHTEYRLVEQTDDEITFLAVGYHVQIGEYLDYDPALKDSYEKSYQKYRFVKTADGWRIAESPAHHSWN